MNIGEIIYDLRKQKGIKQKDLAESLGITATYLSLVENGEKKPGVDLIANVAKYFDLPVSAIFFKALEIDKIKDKKQKKYFEAAEPIVDSLINYLLSGDNTAKGNTPLAGIKHNLRRRKSIK